MARISVVLADTIVALKSVGAVAVDVEYDRRLEHDKPRIEASFEVQIPLPTGVTKMIATVESVLGVRRVQVQRSIGTRPGRTRSGFSWCERQGWRILRG